MSVIHTPEGPMIVAEKCGTCDGTGDETMDSMLAVGVPGGQFPIGPCPACHGTKYIIPDEATEDWLPVGGEKDQRPIAIVYVPDSDAKVTEWCILHEQPKDAVDTCTGWSNHVACQFVHVVRAIPKEKA